MSILDRLALRCAAHCRTPCRETLAVVAVFTIGAVIVHAPLVRDLANALPNDLGDPLLNTWILAWDADRMRHGFAGLWDTPMFYPYDNTLAYSEHLLGIAVFTAPLQWLTGHPVVVYNVAFLASFVLAGAGMYLLASTLTGSRLAGAVGGVAFAFLPFRADHVSHLQVLMYGWMPVALWGLHRYLDTGRRWALAAFAVAFLLQGLSNGYYFYFFAAAVVVVGLAGLAGRVRTRPVMVVELGAAAALMLVALVPVAAAYLDARDAQSLYRSRDEIVMLSADVLSYFHAATKLALWGDVLPPGKGEARLFPGFAMLGLATFGVLATLVGSAAREPSPALRRTAVTYFLVGAAGFVLSLGPEPAYDGSRIVNGGPYDWLLRVVPGLDGLRVPARCAIVVFLALAVNASVGARRLLDLLPSRAAVALSVMMMAAFVAEGYYTVEMSPFSPEPPPEERDAYAWLAASPPGAALMLPFNPRDPVPNTLRYVYRTLEHRHPIVNGYSGYTTNLVRFLERPTTPLRHYDAYDDLVRGLRALGVRYVAVHRLRFRDNVEGPATLAAIRAQADQLVGEHDFGASSVFELRPWDETSVTPAAGQPAIDPRTFRATMSHAQHRMPLAFDGDRDTRWISGMPQSGNEWIELAFAEPTDVAHVRLWMAERSLDDYPRQLLVEGTPDGITYTELYQGRGFPRLLIGLLDNLRYVPIDVALPPNATRTLRLRQTRADPTFFWSIHEIELWAR